MEFLATAIPVVINLGALATVWWQIDTKMEKRLDKIETKMETKMETVNQAILSLTHDVGELKGQVSALMSIRQT